MIGYDGSDCSRRALEFAGSLADDQDEVILATVKRCTRAGVSVEWVPIPAIYDGAPSSFRPFRETARVTLAALAS